MCSFFLRLVNILQGKVTNFQSIFSDDISEDEEFSETDINKQQTKEDHSSREASPLKESILNKFSKFSSKSPNPSINNGDPQQQSNEIPSNLLDDELNNVSGVGVGQPKPSWYHQVRGKIEEKYTEYKNEKDMKRLQNENSLNFDSNLDDLLLDDDDDDNENEFVEKDDKIVKTLSHSFSDDSIPVKESDEMNLGRDATFSRNFSCKFIQNLLNFFF